LLEKDPDRSGREVDAAVGRIAAIASNAKVRSLALQSNDRFELL